MKIHTFKQTQIVPISLDVAWDFFSNPKNLSVITPPEMNFRVTSELPEKIYAGLIITYKVSPAFGINVNWVTEITQSVEPNFFIDEQRFGPYKFWHHQHLFKKVSDGVEMLDIVHYAIPFGIFGSIAKPFIKQKLEHIFNYRSNRLDELFISK